MFTPKQKRMISEKVQEILQAIDCDELPQGEIQFVLHVDGEEQISWANIRNNGGNHEQYPLTLDQNLNLH